MQEGGIKLCPKRCGSQTKREHPAGSFLGLTAPQVIPCFGVHPWFAHTHALTPGTRLADITTDERTDQQRVTPAGSAYLDQSSPSADLSVAVSSSIPAGSGLSASGGPVLPTSGASPSLASGRSPEGGHQLTCSPTSTATSPSSSSRSSALDLSRELSVSWSSRLRDLLLMYPTSWVGEFGLDRAAVIRGGGGGKVGQFDPHGLRCNEDSLMRPEVGQGMLG